MAQVGPFRGKKKKKKRARHVFGKILAERSLHY